MLSGKPGKRNIGKGRRKCSEILQNNSSVIISRGNITQPFTLVGHFYWHCYVGFFRCIFIPPTPPNIVWLDVYCFCPVRLCVRPCLHPETLLTRFLAEYSTHFHQTYILCRVETFQLVYILLLLFLLNLTVERLQVLAKTRSVVQWRSTTATCWSQT